MVSRENISFSKAGISMSVRNEAKVNSNTQRFIVYFGRSYFFGYGATFNFTRGGKGELWLFTIYKTFLEIRLKSDETRLFGSFQRKIPGSNRTS